MQSKLRWMRGAAAPGVVVVVVVVVGLTLAGCGDADSGASSLIDVSDAVSDVEDTAVDDDTAGGDDTVEVDTGGLGDTTEVTDAVSVDDTSGFDTVEAYDTQTDDIGPEDTGPDDTSASDVAASDTSAATDTEPADTGVQDFPPTLGALSDIKMSQGTTRDVVLAIFDDTPDALTITATSSDSDVVGPDELVVGLADDGMTPVLMLAPTADATGMAIITVEVEDAAGAVATEGFRLTVNVASTWTGVTGSTAGIEDEVRGVATDEQGNTYVAGFEWKPSHGEHVGRVRAYDKHGVELWSVPRQSPHDVLLNAIVYWPAMNWVVIASQDKNVANSNSQYAVVAAHDAATGVEVWQDQIDVFTDTAEYYTVGHSLSVTDTSLFMGGPFRRLLSTGGSEYGAWLGRWDTTDLAAGASWQQELGVANTDLTRVGHILPTSDGGAFVVGRTALPGAGTTPLGDGDVLLYRYTSDGTVVATHRYGTAQLDSSISMAQLPNGRLLIGGITHGDLSGPSFGERDSFVMLVDLDGSPLWTQQFGTAGTDAVLASVVMPNEDVVVVGYYNYEGDVSCDAFVRRMNTKSGDLVWETILPNPTGFTLARNVAAIGDDVMVVGRTGLGANTDSIILRVDANGVVQ